MLCTRDLPCRAPGISVPPTGTACNIWYQLSSIPRLLAQALERDERGRKLQDVHRKRRKGHGDRRPPNYFRIVRPVTGFSSNDMSYNVRIHVYN